LKNIFDLKEGQKNILHDSPINIASIDKSKLSSSSIKLLKKSIDTSSIKNQIFKDLEKFGNPQTNFGYQRDEE